jgi:hypothetical protein
MDAPYNYIVIKENYPELERESVLLHNEYNRRKKFAFICKGANKDGSESIYYIEYSNDLAALQARAKLFISWWNYPLGVGKTVQGELREI